MSELLWDIRRDGISSSGQGTPCCFAMFLYVFHIRILCTICVRGDGGELEEEEEEEEDKMMTVGLQLLMIYTICIK